MFRKILRAGSRQNIDAYQEDSAFFNTQKIERVGAEVLKIGKQYCFSYRPHRQSLFRLTSVPSPKHPRIWLHLYSWASISFLNLLGSYSSGFISFERAGSYKSTCSSNGLGELLSDIGYYLMQQINSEDMYGPSIGKKDYCVCHSNLKSPRKLEQTFRELRRNLELFFKGLVKL